MPPAAIVTARVAAHVTARVAPFGTFTNARLLCDLLKELLALDMAESRPDVDAFELSPGGRREDRPKGRTSFALCLSVPASPSTLSTACSQHMVSWEVKIARLNRTSGIALVPTALLRQI